MGGCEAAEVGTSKASSAGLSAWRVLSGSPYYKQVTSGGDTVAVVSLSPGISLGCWASGWHALNEEKDLMQCHLSTPFTDPIYLKRRACDLSSSLGNSQPSRSPILEPAYWTLSFFKHVFCLAAVLSAALCISSFNYQRPSQVGIVTTQVCG